MRYKFCTFLKNIKESKTPHCVCDRNKDKLPI